MVVANFWTDDDWRPLLRGADTDPTAFALHDDTHDAVKARTFASAEEIDQHKAVIHELAIGDGDAADAIINAAREETLTERLRVLRMLQQERNGPPVFPTIAERQAATFSRSPLPSVVRSAWLAMRLLDTPKPTTAHHSIAWDVLRDHGWPDDDDVAQAALARELAATMREAREALGMRCVPPGWAVPLDADGRATGPLEPVSGFDYFATVFAPIDGMLPLDARAAAFLEGDRFGVHGKETADGLRTAARERLTTYQRQQSIPGEVPSAAALFKSWFVPVDWMTLPGDAPQSPRFALNLCRVLWRSVVEPRLKEERAKLPALQLQIFDDIGRLTRRGNVVEHRDDGPRLVDVNGEVVAEIPTLPAEKLAVIHKAASQLASLTGIRMIRHFAIVGHRQVMAHSSEPRVLRWAEGGATAIANDIQEYDHEAMTRVRRALEAGQSFHRQWAGGEVGGMWTYKLPRRGPSDVVLGTVILPYYGIQHDDIEQWLVPVVALPPFVPRKDDHAAQANFQDRVMAMFVRRRLQLVEEGGALLTREDLERLAALADLDPATMMRAMDRWTQDGTDGPAFLSRVGRDRYHLAENATYRDARRWLEATGRMTQGAIKGGKAAVASRKRKREQTVADLKHKRGRKVST